jgi:hypothetical protein
VEPKVSLRYRSSSHSGFLSLKQHIEQSELWGKIVEIKFEAVMSASAPAFQFSASVIPDIPSLQSEGLTAEELKQQQIAQLYQYYNSVLAQQD